MAPSPYDIAGQLADDDAWFIDTLEEYLCNLLERYGHSDRAPNRMLREHTARQFQSGSAHRRPRITLAVSTGLGSDYTAEQQIRVAAVPQLVHEATLELDDVGDDAQQRRGTDSFWYGLAGEDGLDERTAKDLTAVHVLELTHLPYAVIDSWGDVPAADRQEMKGLMSDTIRQLCEGQAIDLYADQVLEDAPSEQVASDEGEASSTLYQELADLKTGSLIATAAEFGGIMAGAPREPVRAWGDHSGWIYQAQDDVVDTPDLDGKGYGTDLVEGRPTILWKTAIERDESGRIGEIWRRPPEDVSPADIEEAWTLAKENGSVGAVVDSIAERKQAADARLAELDWEHPEARRHLEGLTAELVQRARRGAKA